MAFFETINDFFTFFTRRKNKTKVYDTAKKQLNLSKMLDPEDIYRIISDVSTGSYNSSIFNKFFDLNIGRADRYSEYEQMYYRIPEAAAAIHIMTDLILAPNIGNKNNHLKYFPKDGPLGAKAETYAKTLLESTTFIDYLPKIIFNSLFYGDCFVSNRKTNYGIQYTIHDTKETSMLFDKSTGINLGIVVKVPRMTDTVIDKILSLACPSITLDVPRKTAVIISQKIKTLRDFDYNTKIKEMEDLISEVLLNTNNNTMIDFKYFPPGKYTAFSIYYNDFYYPYGTSILDPLRAVAKQLLLTEAALSIYRMTRAPLRYKFLVEVGSLPEKDIRGILNSIKDSIKKDRVISDANNSSIDAIPDMMAPEEDFWIPVVNGTPWMDIVPLEGANLEPYVGDVEYFKKKFIAGLGLPPSYLGHEEGTSTRALLTLEDMRFNRTIKKYQRDINIGLTDLSNNNLQLAEVPELVGQVEVELPQPHNLEDNIRIENLSSRMGVANDFSGLFPDVPKLWIMKNIVCIDQSEIDDMEDSIEEQKKYRIFIDNKPGNIGSGGDLIDTGIGSDFNTDFGDIGDFSTNTDIGNMESGDDDLKNLDFDKALDNVSSDTNEETSTSEGELQL